jgi:EpsI family protein
MGTMSPFRVILLLILLAATALLVHGPMEAGLASKPKVPLREAFERFGGWSGGGNLQLSEQIIDGLKLDDYLFRGFEKGKQTVTIYIGYYRTAGKVGAAHDPLVCFQGQGWGIVERAGGRCTVAGNPDLSVSYSSMIAERNGEKELIVYWFQANERSSDNTLSQKVDMVRDRIFGHGEDNAFVRITTPIGDGKPEEARKRIFDFVDAFYPTFHRYMVRK